MEAHHISQNGVCICLSPLPNKEIVIRMCDVPENIRQGLNKNPKIMKKFVKVAERTTNSHKYRLFLFFA
jgi:hypothetical protein